MEKMCITHLKKSRPKAISKEKTPTPQFEYEGFTKNDDDIFKDYRPKVDKKEKQLTEIKTAEKERKMNEANRLKKDLFKMLNEKGKERKMVIKVRKSHLRKTRVKEKIKHVTYDTLDGKKYSKAKRRTRRYIKMKVSYLQKKKKMNKKKSNFLVTQSYVDSNETDLMSHITDWKFLMEQQIRQIFRKKSLSVNFLVKSLSMELMYKQFFEVSPDKPAIERKLDYLQNFEGKPLSKEEEKPIEESKVIEQDDAKKKLDKEKIKMMLSEFKEKEKKLKEEQEATNKFLKEINQYHKGLEDNQYKITENLQGQIHTPSEELLSEDEARKIKQRLINYTLKTFDKFKIEEILYFWYKMRKELPKERARRYPEKVERETKKEDKSEIEKKKAQKELNVKHVFTQPKKEIKQIIPFASKKFTIQKKDA